MIHCPYCGSPTDDAARSCPRCKSILVEETEEGKKPFPRLLHPFAALIVVVLLSGVLLAVHLASGRPEERPAKRPPERAAERPARPKAPRRGRTQTVPPAVDAAEALESGADDMESAREEYAAMLGYEEKVKAYMEEAGKLDKELRGLQGSEGKGSSKQFGERLREFQSLTSRMRNLVPPSSARRAHTRLANSFAIRQRAYRSLMAYMKKGDVGKLDQARRDLETAKQEEDKALSEIAGLLEKLEPPPPPERAEESAPQAEAGDTSDEAPGSTQPEAPPLGGGTVHPDEGATVYPGDGSTVYPGEGTTVYPGDGSTAYPEEGPYYETYPPGRPY